MHDFTVTFSRLLILAALVHNNITAYSCPMIQVGNKHASYIANMLVPLVGFVQGLAPQVYHLQSHTSQSKCLVPPQCYPAW